MQVMPDGTRQPIADKTDWAWLNAMTEEEIEAAALADEDNPPLTQAELKRMRRVPCSGLISPDTQFKRKYINLIE
jgi:hypothetical protein